MKPQIYVARRIPAEVEAYLKEHAEVRKWEQERPITKDELKEEVGDAEGLLIAGTPITEELLANAPNLKVVSNISVGYNNLNIDALRSRGVLATHTPYVLDDTVADLAFTLILSASRRVVELDHWVRDGKWQKGQEDELFGVDVHHATLGIIGLGRIGERIARRAIFGFDMKVLYNNRNRKPQVEAELGVSYASMEELLKTSDIVLLMLPLTEETRGLMGAREFDMMKRSAVFINVARGPIVDETALVEALQQRKIFAAGLDVFDREPIDPNHPLLQCTNVVTLPHIGSATAATRTKMAQRAANNLIHALQGSKEIDLIPELKQ
ncbi:bifunctional glyoxylate/hydroxypyruvate reductase B [Paenibacillus selenitireducens]|uniref:Bifunctional glyoxylate/hydroxypyruvate reductase B n=1 Tax=Paenibacillus selenitireducens TaxID=1324314 RepID=A0A1T2WZ35_9BACL|nr:D-glycerate dehydrogenase [Paenibacillus selenitireducens]OPA72888.1 bifunctional glyoxylate/hydroxypyruvate reductase B [Paenibacillus selenitireducens]